MERGRNGRGKKGAKRTITRATARVIIKLIKLNIYPLSIIIIIINSILPFE